MNEYERVMLQERECDQFLLDLAQVKLERSVGKGKDPERDYLVSVAIGRLATRNKRNPVDLFLGRNLK